MTPKKPWEYEEIVTQHSEDPAFGGFWLSTNGRDEVAAVPGWAPGGADAWAKLFKASPALARNLMRQMRQQFDGTYHTHFCQMERRGDPRGTCTDECKEAIATLRAIGMIP